MMPHVPIGSHTAISLLALLYLAPIISLAQKPPRTCSTPTAHSSIVGSEEFGELTGVPSSTPPDAQVPIDPFMVTPPSDALVLIDVKRVLSEAVPRVLGDGETLGGLLVALADLKTLMRLDPRAVKRMVIGVRYSEPIAGTGEPNFVPVMIAQTSEAKELVAALLRELGPDKYQGQQYEGKTVYVAHSQKTEPKIESTAASTGGPEFAVAALDANTIVFGRVTDVYISIDVSAGRVPPVRADLVEAVKRNPNALLNVAGLVPPRLVSAEQQPSSSELSQILSSLKQFHAAVELTPTGFDFAVTLTTAKPEQAKALGEVLAAYKTLAIFIPDKTLQDKLLRELVKGLVISVGGTEVRVRDQITQASANALAKQIAAEIYFYRGLARMDQGDPEAAIADYDKAIILVPDSASAFISRGKSRADKGMLDAAIADYDRAISLDSDSALAYNNRGFARIKKGDFDAAIVDLDRAISLDPNFAFAYNNRGLALAEKGNLDQAMADYDKSIALDTKNAFAYRNRGDARNQKGDWGGAIEDFDKAISINPKSAEAYNGRGLARYVRAELDEAIADYDAAIALDPNEALIYNNRGLAFVATGNLEKAMADYDKSITLDAKNDFVYSNRGDLRNDLGNWDEAIADFDKALTINPKLADAYNSRGIARYCKKELDQAISDFDKAIAINPTFAEAYGNRGLSRLALWRDAEAAQDFKKCFELDASMQPAFETLAKEVKKTRRGRPRHQH